MATQYLQLMDRKIAYDVTGSGPLVVCVPGMGDLRSEYRYLVPQLVFGGFQAATMDVRGHGESSPAWQDYSVAGVGSDILALIRELDGKPAVLIGNSMAAGAAVWAAAEAPDLVSALVLIGPAVHGEVGWPVRLILKAFLTRPWGPSAWIWYYSRLFPSRKPADWIDYTAALKSNLAEPGRLKALLKMMSASKAASADRLSQVNKPVLTIMGSKDPDFKNPQSESDWVTAQLNGISKMIDGAGHYPHTEMPEITGPEVVAFLQSHQVEVRLGSPTR